MKLLKHLSVFFLTCILLFNGCTTNFQLTTKWKNVTIVYGLLNKTDTAQYIKINKAFLNPNTNALTLAQNPDSIFYPNLNVTMQEINTYGQVVNTYTLVKVDGNLEGYPKATGTFANSPNWVYKLKFPQGDSLNANNAYQLIIVRSDNQVITATTDIVNDINILAPYPGTSISMLPGIRSNYIASWVTGTNTAFYGLSVRFHYVEFPVGNPSDSVAKYFDWPIFNSFIPTDTTAGNYEQFQFANNGLYQEIATYISPNSSVNRIARSMDFTYSGGAPAFYNYYNVALAQSGLTQGEIEPIYTNITNGGMGIFSSRVINSRTNIPIAPSTIDSIACNSITHVLGFQNSQGQLCQ